MASRPSSAGCAKPRWLAAQARQAATQSAGRPTAGAPPPAALPVPVSMVTVKCWCSWGGPDHFKPLSEGTAAVLDMLWNERVLARMTYQEAAGQPADLRHGVQPHDRQGYIYYPARIRTWTKRTKICCSCIQAIAENAALFKQTATSQGFASRGRLARLGTGWPLLAPPGKNKFRYKHWIWPRTGLPAGHWLTAFVQIWVRHCWQKRHAGTT